MTRDRSHAEEARSGQSTLEYALVLMAFLSMVLALGAIWHASQEGRLVEQAREAASHGIIAGIDIGLLLDVTAF